MKHDWPIKEVCKRIGDILCVDLAYPRAERNDSAIQIGLLDTRAADDIRICYDFDRDGWVISQERLKGKEDGGVVSLDPPEWVEVAFIEAWALEQRIGDDKKKDDQ